MAGYVFQYLLVICDLMMNLVNKAFIDIAQLILLWRVATWIIREDNANRNAHEEKTGRVRKYFSFYGT